MRYDEHKHRIPRVTELLRDASREHLSKVEWLMQAQRFINTLGNIAIEIGVKTGIEFLVMPSYFDNTANLIHEHQEDDLPDRVRLALDEIEQTCSQRLTFTQAGEYWRARCHLPISLGEGCFFVLLRGQVELILADRVLTRVEAA